MTTRVAVNLPQNSGSASKGKREAVGPGRGGSISGGINGRAPASATPKPLAGRSIAELRESDVIRTLSPEDQKRQALLSKLHPSILAVIERLRSVDAKAGADEVKFIRNGRAEVQIWLTDKSAEVLAKLKKLGFEVVLDPKTAKLVIGRLPIENLEKLAELKEIRYVAPQMAGK